MPRSKNSESSETHPASSHLVTWRCPRCGGDELEGLAWVRLKDEAVETWEENSAYWCPGCEDHIKHICEVTAEGQCLSHDQPFATCRDT